MPQLYSPLFIWRSRRDSFALLRCPKFFKGLECQKNFDRCAISHSLHLPQAALVLNARASALEFENIYNIKIKSTELNRCFLSGGVGETLLPSCGARNFLKAWSAKKFRPLRHFALASSATGSARAQCPRLGARVREFFLQKQKQR